MDHPPKIKRKTYNDKTMLDILCDLGLFNLWNKRVRQREKVYIISKYGDGTLFVINILMDTR